VHLISVHERITFHLQMLDFCGKHNITADVEVIPIQKINEAYERLLKSDVRYRFSIDMASLKSE
jgi:alcohol dehydrogenase (NADP+)